MPLENDLKFAERDLHRAEDHVLQQQELIARLEGDGRSARLAKAQLRVLQESAESHLSRVRALRDELVAELR